VTPATRWALTGALLGALAAAVVFAPARWVAWALLQASQGRVVLGHAQGTVWSGHAQVTLTGGPGSRDALTLPGQLSWKLDGSGGWGGLAARLTLRHPGLMPAPLVLRLQPGLGPWSLSLAEGTVPGKAEPPSGTAVLWPAAWLTALGTPWNTLQPSGLLRLSSPGFTLQMAPGGLRLQGSLVLEATDIASRLSTLPRLGSYRVVVAGTGAGSEAATVQLSTLDGALLLSGSGQWTGARLRLRGEARAAPGQEAALQNLLNLIGTRDGARSILSIG
jgi:general secretion pathway protein N